MRLQCFKTIVSSGRLLLASVVLQGNLLNIMVLTDEQKTQVQRQLSAHTHETYRTDIILNDAVVLPSFTVCKDVLRPDTMTSLHLARLLISQNDLFYGKRCIDMGCGSGIQGIVLARSRAAHVTFSDISPAAVANTQENVRAYALANTTIVQGDLFKNAPDKADVIIFNHPFFADEPIDGVPVSNAMLDSGNLLQRFLSDAKQYLNVGGTIIMPYFDLAGPVNHPKVQGVSHGYNVKELLGQEATTGLQTGRISIYELSLPTP